MPKTLAEWLTLCEAGTGRPGTGPATLERSEAVRARLGLRFACTVVSVAGTNGKGSTCAMLEAVALQAGYRVGAYTKPHLVHFEERCRVNGAPVSADALVPHFAAVEAARQGVPLNFFEFTTLVITRLLSQMELDLVILEVGLGGRCDPVNVFDADCAVITSVDIDHAALLGGDRESIGREKAGIMRAGRPVVISDPAPPASVLAHAAAIGADAWRFSVDFNYAGDKQQWSWAGRHKRLNALAYPALRGANQLVNAAGALAVFDALRAVLPITAQAVRNGMAMVELPGRFQIVPGQPTLVLDVAHNPHAVAALALNLEYMGFHPRTHAVFGAMHDKDITAMLARLAPLVDQWHFTALPTSRAATPAELAEHLAQCGVKGPGPVEVFHHPDPATALAAAVAAADPADRIVTLGSFLTVGGVLAQGLPRLGAKHVG